MSVGKTILRIRIEKRLTQREVGRRARLAVSYISRIENDHIQPTIRTLGRLAQALGVRVSSLFRSHEEDHGPAPHRCPVSASGNCIGELIRSEHGRTPPSGKASYGKEELRLLKMTDFLAQHGSRQVRQTLRVLLEALMAKR